MKRAALLFFFLLTLCYSAICQDNVKQKPDLRDCTLALGESLYLNLTVYTLDNLISKNNVPLSISQIKQNMKVPWNFDNSDFPRNQFYHPYLGGLYFNCGRSNNLNFAESFLLAGVSSFTWEYFLGNNALNDLLTTTYAGTLNGEVLHRLYFPVSDINPFLGALVSPVDGITCFVRQKQAFKPQGKVYYGDLVLGSGVQLKPIGWQIHAGASIIYGNPYGHNSRELMDQFSVTGQVYSDFNTGVCFFCINGNLWSWSLFPAEDIACSFGIGTNYKAVLSDSFTYSASDAGVFINQEIPFGTGGNFRYKLESDFIIMESNQVEKVNVFNYGVSEKLFLEMSYDRFLISASSDFDYLFPDFCFFSMSEVKMEYEFIRKWALGIKEFCVYSSREDSLKNYGTLYIRFGGKF